MSFYWHLNESTGKLVYSNASAYDDGSGGSWTALEQTNMDPTSSSVWAFNSHRSSISSVEWDKNNGKIEGLTKMISMFQSCSSLTFLDLSGFDTSQVTSMKYMFRNCSILTSLNLSGFDTSQVTNMSYMFSGCRSLTSLDLSGFDTSLATDMSYMFNVCSGLTSLDLSDFDTSQVTSMYNMFYDCSSLTALDLSGLDTSQVTDMGGMFYDCSSLTSLDLSGFDTSKVTNRGIMFSRCSSLRILAISGSMSNVLSQLPAAQYYSAAGGAAVARADLTAGTWIKDAGDLSVCTSLVDLAQARMALSRSVTKLAKRIAKMK